MSHRWVPIVLDTHQLIDIVAPVKITPISSFKNQQIIIAANLSKNNELININHDPELKAL